MHGHERRRVVLAERALLRVDSAAVEILRLCRLLRLARLAQQCRERVDGHLRRHQAVKRPIHVATKQSGDQVIKVLRHDEVASIRPVIKPCAGPLRCARCLRIRMVGAESRLTPLERAFEEPLWSSTRHKPLHH